MKFTIEVDATPKEVRESLGLPDISGIQDRILERIEEKVMATIETYDPVKLLKMFVPEEGTRLLSGLQKTVFEGVLGGRKSKRKQDSKKDKKST